LENSSESLPSGAGFSEFRQARDRTQLVAEASRAVALTTTDLSSEALAKEEGVCTLEAICGQGWDTRVPHHEERLHNLRKGDGQL